MKTINYIIIFLLFFCELSYSKPVKDGFVSAELISEFKQVKIGEPFWIGVRFVMDKDWHIYWLNPGDAGLATIIEWNMPKGLKVGELIWEIPHKFEFEGLASYGYSNEVLLMAQVIPDKKSIVNSSESIKAKIDWLMCKEKCIPGKAELELPIVYKDNMIILEKDNKQTFSNSRKNQPIKKNNFKYSAKGNDKGVELTIENNEKNNINFSSIEFYPFDGGIFNIAEKQEIKILSKNIIKLKINFDPYKIEQPVYLSGLLINENGWKNSNNSKAIEVKVKIENN